MENKTSSRRSNCGHNTRAIAAVTATLRVDRLRRFSVGLVNSMRMPERILQQPKSQEDEVLTDFRLVTDLKAFP